MNADRPALVGFVGPTDLWWLRGLRPGFRHCFVALSDGDGWIVVDPMSHRTLVRREAVADLAPFYAGHGIIVLPTRMRAVVPPRTAPWRPYTCVEAVKRILGVRAPWVLTPWQLYRHLEKENNP